MATTGVRKWPGVFFGVLVIVLAVGNRWVGAYPYGAAVWIRPLVALVGIAGAICLFRGSRWWQVLLPVWSVVQVLVIATDPSGEWFYQGLFAGYRGSRSVRVNHVLTQYSAQGFNFAGLVLLGMVGVIIVMRWHPEFRRRGRWMLFCRKHWRVGVTGLLGLLLLVVAGAWAKGYREQQATYVMKLDLPNVPIYYKGQMLGRTPLRITPERVRAWKLPLDADAKLNLFGFGWGDCAILSDGKAYLPLYAGVPWFFSSYLDRFETPWGERCRMNLGGERGNERSGYMYRRADLRAEPVLEVEVLDAQPVAAGSPFHVRCRFRNPTGENYTGREARIERLCFPYDHRDVSYTPRPEIQREVTMPATWNALPSGGTMNADVEFDAPAEAGEYEFFCVWNLYAPGNDQHLSGAVYSNMVRLRVK